jgi:hypothetical protein
LRDATAPEVLLGGVALYAVMVSLLSVPTWL